MGTELKLLLVDDEKDFRNLLRVILEKQGYVVDVAENGRKAINMIEKNDYDVVLTDMKMDEVDGIQLLEYIKAHDKKIECIIITGFGSVKNAVEAMKKGAFSYFIKSNNPQELLFDIEKICKIKSLSDQNNLLKDEIGRYDYILKSKNHDFQKVIKYATKVAKTDSNVLLLGESGVGKEVIARFIHRCSNRKNEIFMAVNCHSFSDSLLEAELYGHEKGAFTGSYHMRKGRFEASDKGTLFLDEIGDIPLSTQIKILRNIENKEIERIGNNKSIKIDFRLICATNKDLKNEIFSNRFRKDLYYRISTVILEIPPLRRRKEDLPILIDFFLKKAQKDLKKNIEGLDDNLMNVLLNYNYPGNVRELKNIIERLVVIAENKKLTLRDVSQYDVFSDSRFSNNKKSLKEVRRLAERNHIIRILESSDFNIDKAAEILQITSRQLYNKINEYDIKIRKKN
ncbi:sigma-54-dependent transcriptional regulator [Paramaledivibacter caminithermalis]|uniref:Stage 0 sporulation protein A homolog n=1 Tax=Paramaledivibacter caminithermalis (strain DSM 15212 / CIP 107654 / DViRD3) TaxID=1121301 RepID=A0A1M6RB09_PARC5|nr:sigma-54 dependent transcriptional regulator [Paramaledivibacter caminithermalis]SHK29649.1 DNA-binding transcriptional response regulator, NtrC family, contains REC, AAA-type ATPase, and a Fis-type DNA-binding domains [Paramaledivibacter caminithermalis DSM 15212]